MAMLRIKCSSCLTSAMLALPQPELPAAEALHVFPSPFPLVPSPSSLCVGTIQNWVPSLAWSGEQVLKLGFFGLVLFFPFFCEMQFLLTDILFSVYPLLDPLPLFLTPALHRCTKMSVILQNLPPPGAWSGPEGTSLVPAPLHRGSLLATDQSGRHRDQLEATHACHWGL